MEVLKNETKNGAVQQHKVDTNDQKKNHKDEKEESLKANKGKGVQNSDKSSKDRKEQTKKDTGKAVQPPNKNSKKDKEQAKN